MEYEFQKAELVEEYEVWLRAIYKNPSASEKELLIKNFNQLGHDFNPQDMPHILLSAPRIPSLFALSFIDRDNKMIGFADEVFKYIKKKLQRDPSTLKVTSKEIADSLNRFESDANEVLGHIGKLPNTFGSAQGCPGEKFGFSEIGFGEDIRSFTAYFKHDSIYDLIEESYLNYMKHSGATTDAAPNHPASLGSFLQTESFVTKAKYIDQSIINTLKAISSNKYDLSRLVRLCDEINFAHETESYYALTFLVRAVLDHVPPVFSVKTFAEVASKAQRSQKDLFVRLEGCSRKLADSYLHQQIRKKHVQPNLSKVDFRTELAELLEEIIHELHS